MDNLFRNFSDIDNICIKAAEAMKSFVKPVTLKSSVFGDGCQLDSLDFVEYCLSIEKLVQAQYHKSIKLVDPQLFLHRTDNPYRTVAGISSIVSSLVGPSTSSEVQKPITTLGVPKLVLTDLDGTLWDGTAGEDLLTVSCVLETLYNLQAKGVIIGVITKSHKQTIEQASAELSPPIDWSRFVVQSYGVTDKAQAIRDVLEHLGLSERDTIYIDDQPYERARVYEAIPTIRAVLEPGASQQIAAPEVITSEDKIRTDMYVQEYDRRRSAVGQDFMAWLSGLGMQLTISRSRSENQRARGLQLLERANQFNFVKRAEYILEPDQKEYVVSLKDKYGDCGIIAVLRTRGPLLTDFAVSCRVLGRGVEETVLKWVRSNGVNQVSIQINERNLAAQEFMAKYRGLGHVIDQTSFPITVFEEDCK
jgi:FkbH-like protein